MSPKHGWSRLLLILAVVSACGRGVSGEIFLETQEADFGTIPNDQPISYTFEIRNAGAGALEITELSTSCSCTTVDAETREIAPGASATLTVTFDPQAHAGATGQFLRKVYIRSNDPDTPEVVFTFTVEVVEFLASGTQVGERTGVLSRTPNPF